MPISLIAFIVSGAGLFLLIALKMLQEKLGLLLFWPDIRQKAEIALQKRAVRFQQFREGFSKRSLYIFLHFILSKARAFFVYLQHKIDRRLVHLVNLIKGRHIVDSTRGKASHFLHDITRFKDRFKRH